MKKHFIPGLIVFIVLCAIPLYVFAQLKGVTKRPFGGQVILTAIPAVTCAAQYGAMIIRPVNIAPPAPYYITTTTKNVKPGSWLLGWYSVIPSFNTCYTSTTPSVPVPSFKIDSSFGISK